jgi:hypothetical protein
VRESGWAGVRLIASENHRNEQDREESGGWSQNVTSQNKFFLKRK